MSGLGGHIDNVWESRDLTFDDLKEIVSGAANNRFGAIEKFDGQNIFASWSMRRNELVVARNLTDIKMGGMGSHELGLRFECYGENVAKSFVEGYNALSAAISGLGEWSRCSLFGDAEKWFSAEIVHTCNPNVIRYDRNFIVLHGSSQKERKISLCSDGVVGVVDQLNDSVKGSGWSVIGPTPIKMADIDDFSIEDCALEKLDELERESCLIGSSTIRDFIAKRMRTMIIDVVGTSVGADIVDSVALRASLNDTNKSEQVLGVRPRSLAVVLENFIRPGNIVVRRALFPLETILHEFSVGLMKYIVPTYVPDHHAEALRIVSLTRETIDEIKSGKNQRELTCIEHHADKLALLDDFTNAVEGIVFCYNGLQLKLTGMFGSINAVLGIKKYNDRKFEVSYAAGIRYFKNVAR